MMSVLFTMTPRNSKSEEKTPDFFCWCSSTWVRRVNTHLKARKGKRFFDTSLPCMIIYGQARVWWARHLTLSELVFSSLNTDQPLCAPRGVHVQWLRFLEPFVKDFVWLKSTNKTTKIVKCFYQLHIDVDVGWEEGRCDCQNITRARIHENGSLPCPVCWSKTYVQLWVST